MSVLLEALKKAAEEKKKQVGGLSEKDADQSQVSPQKEVLISEADIEGDVLQEPVEPSVTEQVTQPYASVDVDESSWASIREIKQPKDGLETTVIEDEETPLEFAKHDVEQEMDATHPPLQVQIPEEIQHEVPEEPAPFRLEQSTQVLPSIEDDLETRLAVSDTVVEESSAPQHEEPSALLSSDEDRDFPPENINQVEAFEAQAESEQDSSDWSLAQIPGYQDYAETKNKQEKTRLILPHFSQQKTHKPNKWRLYVMSSILVVVGFGYYAMLYFDEQSTVVDDDMQRYQVMHQSTFPSNPSPKAPTEKLVSNASAQDNQALSPEKLSVAPTIKETLIEHHEKSATKETVEVAAKKDDANRTPVKKAKVESSQDDAKAKKNLVLGNSKNLRIMSQPYESKVSLAYKAYQQNDWHKAETYYQQAYQEDAQSIAALFGLGAVSIHKGEKNKALDYYQKILTLEPNNQLAQKAILGIKSSENAGVQTLDSLKQMAEINPEDSTLFFAIGNVYAKRKDWVSAQSYYFKAYQHRPHEAIYALNLAVSLDQLGEYRLAKQYYEEALAKSPADPSLFDTKSIKKRVLVLNQFLSKEK